MFFVPYIVNSCDVTVHALGKYIYIYIYIKGSKNANVGLETWIQTHTMLATFSGLGLPRVIIVKDLVVPGHSNRTPIGIHRIQVSPSWMDSLVSFLRDGILLEDKCEAEKI